MGPNEGSHQWPTKGMHIQPLKGPQWWPPWGPQCWPLLDPSYWAIVGCPQKANTCCSINAVSLLTKLFIDQKNMNANACTTLNQSYSPGGAKRHLNWFSHFCMVITEAHIKTCIGKIL